MLATTDSSPQRDAKAQRARELTVPTGVSAIVCCYNSASRLPATLAHLASQRCEGRFPWEVILVDNASTDGTGRIAQELWPQDAPVHLRVVHEARLGLAYARQRGISAARYELLSFVDDDNWVCPNWVQLVWELMS
ncbi:MAG TPA: glycosyltransferase, partial [Terriglobales bacterium]|nr:glycosyltransferase [Terriglobales bacterium]